MRMLANSMHAHAYFLLKDLIQVYGSSLSWRTTGFNVQQPSLSCYFFSTLFPKEWKTISEELKNEGSAFLSFKMLLHNSSWVKNLFCQNQSNQTKISKNLEVPKQTMDNPGFLIIFSTETADWAPRGADKSPPAAL